MIIEDVLGRMVWCGNREFSKYFEGVFVWGEKQVFFWCDILILDFPFCNLCRGTSEEIWKFHAVPARKIVKTFTTSAANNVINIPERWSFKRNDFK